MLFQPNNEYAVCNMLAFAVECAPNFFLCEKKRSSGDESRSGVRNYDDTSAGFLSLSRPAICFHKKEEKRESRQRRKLKGERVFVVVEMNFSRRKAADRLKFSSIRNQNPDTNTNSSPKYEQTNDFKVTHE